MTGPASKRPRRSKEEQCMCRCVQRKMHLYQALYECKEVGILELNIHKLDADNLEDDALPEPVVRFTAPERAPMALIAVGTSIFIATSPHLRDQDEATAPPPLPTLVYDTETAALTIGPRLPDGYLDGDSGGVPTVVSDNRLYTLTKFYDGELRQHSVSLRILSRTHTASSCIPSETIMAWSWNWNWNGGSPPPSPPPSSLGSDVINLTSYAVHPDGRTIFMSTPGFTWSFDTGGNGVWKELGCWSLPFTGQAFFDGDLDAWVGLYRKKEGMFAVAGVPSRSAASASASATVAPECKMPRRRRCFSPAMTTSSDSRFCLVDNVPNSRDSLDATLRTCHAVWPQV